MREKAFSLLELLVVVVILALLAGAVVRTYSSGDIEQKLQLAAEEVSSALRFARAEAIRTGEHHGARIGAADHRVRVYRLDTSGSPPVEVFSVYNPVDKKLYDLALIAAPFTTGVKVDKSDFRFGGVSTQYESVSFAADGTPVSPVDLALLDQVAVRTLSR